MTTLPQAQVPGVGTPNEKAATGASNTQAASDTTNNTEILSPAPKISKSVMQSGERHG
jgi:hypothetical protein